MNRQIKLLATCLLISAVGARAQNSTATTLSVGVGGELQVSDHGKTTISTTYGGPLLYVHQAGGGYGSGSTNAALMLSTDGVGDNYLLSAGTTGVVNFSLKAGGQAYFGGNVGIGTATPEAPLVVASGHVIGNYQVYNALTVRPATGNGSYVGNGSSIYMGSITNHGVDPVGGIWSVLGSGGNGGVNYSGGLVLGTTGSGSAVPTERVRIDEFGNLGIGTNSPGAKLDVVGTMRLSGSGASLTFSDGTTQSTAWNGTLCGGDYAESVDVAGDRTLYQPGDVLVISDDESADVKRSQQPYSTMVSGIYSTKPGMVGRRQQSKDTSPEVPMAMIGIVPTKVTTENGAIKRGDLLVTSSLEGYAMKGTDHIRMLGAVIGKALGTLASGKGMIEVLVTLQ